MKKWKEHVKTLKNVAVYFFKNFVKGWRRNTILTNKYIIIFSNYFYDEIEYILDYINFHKLIVSNYISIYEINDISNEVLILHIFHNTQNYLNLL